MMTASSAPVRQSSVRAHNLALVLQTVANSADPISRAAVAAATGLTRATVSALVDDLIAGKLLVEVEPAPRSGAGRPAAGLRLAPDGPAGLGLEINVDYRAACVVDLTGRIRHRLVEAGDQRPVGAGSALAALSLLATEARRRAEADGLTVAGAALAVPGLVTGDDTVRIAPNLGWLDVAVGELGGLPVAVDNEANLAALSELGTGELPPSFVYISGEIGIGAGIVLDGALFRGVRGWSGEIGHLAIDPDGPPCRCGARGCLEQYAGQEAMLRAAGAATVADLAAADLSTAGHALGTAIAAVVNLLDVGTVVLGGIYAPLLPRLRDAIGAEIDRRVLTADWSPVQLRAASYGPDAAMRGAAGAVIRGVLDDPAGWLARTRA
ncbi:ROK family protein [Pseudosporangium ferrugineum]|uniref:Putative NBD/HSP70 family sugar kinase n=1 Tax=Pseudosporangium ferrugineum TaxID=439699 RepID=A0A2T0RIS3_9ACTN|nr:putative NBD/HSP70 family sugar kinase [Pseudosporangium ferrugineum]